MATFVTLGKYTQQGVMNLKDGAVRLDTARQAARSMGAEIREFYLLMGQYDFMVIAEAPDDTTIARLVLAIAGQGNISTETVRAFDEDEFRGIVAGLP